MNFLDSKKHYSNISTMFLPPDYWNGKYYCCAWGQLEPKDFGETLKLERIISETEIKYCSKRWEELRRENTYLRLMVGGKLISLNENFLDGFIKNALSKMSESFKIEQLVEMIIGECGLMIGDIHVFEGVHRLIERGKIVLLEEWNEIPMRTIVKKYVKMRISVKMINNL